MFLSRLSLFRCGAVFAACVLVAACATESSDPSGGDDPTSSSGSGAGPPLRPEDVPAERLEGDVAQCAPAFATVAPIEGLNTGYESGGQSREFVLLLPDASFEGPRPMFVGFNGTTEDGPGFAERARLADFAARGFIVVVPSSVGNGTLWPVWDSMRAPGDDAPNLDLAYFDSFVSCIAVHHQVDKNRIYIGGHSAGGIMSNYLLQRRSELLAGAIHGSGVHSLTTVADAPPMSDTFALITWGGDNDEWGGSTDEGVSVPKFNFVEQASIASKFYDAEPNVGQVACHGANIGHAWLSPINDWMIDELLRHPKGVSGADGVDVPASPGGGVSCTGSPVEFTGGVTVVCPLSSAVQGCGEYCQLVADCAVENGSVSNILGPQLLEMGFSGSSMSDCGGCVTHCERTATTAADDQVLGCIDKIAQSRTCGPGIDGALPVLDAINECCEGRSDSPLCMDTCTIMRGNSSTDSFLPTCVALVPTP
jgi:poly(3-hydroxybutyrate) depolymerase